MIATALLAHPYKASLNHAFFARACARLAERGVEVRKHDLYEEAFDPVMPTEELGSGISADALVNRHAGDLRDADLLLVVHPNWWGQPPAILTGWIDRVLRPPLAYDLAPDATGFPVAHGCLGGKRALVITTSNTDAAFERDMLGDPLSRIWGPCVLGFCGFEGWERRNFAIVERSDEALRKAWLEEVDHLADLSFDMAFHAASAAHTKTGKEKP